MTEARLEKMTPARFCRLSLRGLAIIKKLFPWYLTLTAVSALLEAARPLATLWLSARILDELSGARSLGKIALYAALAVGLNFVFTALISLIARRTKVDKATLWRRWRLSCAERYARLDYEYVERSRLNEMLSGIEARDNGNGLGISRLFWNFSQPIRRLFALAGSVLLLAGMFAAPAGASRSFVTSPWAAALLGALLALSLFARLLLTRFEGRGMQAINANLPKSNQICNYYIDYLKVGAAAKDIRLFDQKKTVEACLNASAATWMWPLVRFESLANGFGAAVGGIFSGGVYLLIGLRALAGMYGIGQVTQYVGAVTAFSDNLSGLVDSVAALWENARYLPLIYEYLDLPDLRRRGSLTTEKRADNDYEIEFRHVSFQYPGSETWALRDLSLKLRVGERLAVVGQNGSGKTTMIKLLCRLYDPTEGEITLNGIDIRKYDYGEYMGIFAVVFQDFRLLSFPLGQNVAASERYDGDRVARTLSTVGFDARMEKMTKGLDTPLYKEYDEDGVMISGGEAQKIALARAVYKDAPFLVLDEPTAALDPIAEYEIYTKFNDIVGGRTAVYISHRLSSCRFCSRIAVFDGGRLVQLGNHDELLRDAGGKYSELWHAQAQYYAKNTSGGAGEADGRKEAAAGEARASEPAGAAV